MNELVHRYRPKGFKTVVGQEAAIKTLEKFLEKNDVPHAILFTGPSGVGKTTLCRILKSKMNCSDEDYQEINAAENRGIEVVRGISSRMRLSPMAGGGCKIFLFDEAHQLVKKAGGDAQTALLKTLEEPPSHVYFFLCTTHPNELLPTIRTRCTEIKLDALSPKHLSDLVNRICEKEGKKTDKEVVEQLVEASEGSARKAVVILNQIVDLPTKEEQLDAIMKADSKRVAIEIAKMLLYQKTKWPDLAKIIKDVNEPEESLRHMILSWCTNEVLKGGSKTARAMQIIEVFRDHLYDSRRAGFVANCYELCNSK